MNKQFNFSRQLTFIATLAVLIFTISGCNKAPKEVKSESTATIETPEYFNLRPKLEKEYGYSHAVKIGNDLKISGAVSMDDAGVIVAPGNME